jgi:hypothetical protein
MTLPDNEALRYQEPLLVPVQSPVILQTKSGSTLHHPHKNGDEDLPRDFHPFQEP